MTPVEERIDHHPQIALEHELRVLIEGSVIDMAAGQALVKRVHELNRAYLALLAEIKRLRGWPEIKVGAQSPPHSPVDRYRCENLDCEIESAGRPMGMGYGRRP